MLTAAGRTGRSRASSASAPARRWVSRIQVRNNAANIRLNDNDNPVALALGAHFAGLPDRATMRVQTDAGVAVIPTAGSHPGGGYVNFAVPDDGAREILRGIGSGRPDHRGVRLAGQ